VLRDVVSGFVRGRLLAKRARAIQNVAAILGDGEEAEITLLGKFDARVERPRRFFSVTASPGLALATLEVTLTNVRLLALRQSRDGMTADLAFACDRGTAQASIRRGITGDRLRLTFDTTLLILGVPHVFRAEAERLVGDLQH
jgi:hypothetical protein